MYTYIHVYTYLSTIFKYIQLNWTEAPSGKGQKVKVRPKQYCVPAGLRCDGENCTTFHATNHAEISAALFGKMLSSFFSTLLHIFWKI